MKESTGNFSSGNVTINIKKALYKASQSEDTVNVLEGMEKETPK
jgi:hypothetical protein